MEIIKENHEDIIIDGLSVRYRFMGDGDKYAVILQGWGTTYSVYDSVAELLARYGGYRVLQFDLPGFGQSEEPDTSWSVEEYKNFFLKLMKVLGIESALLFGHSYGGRIIIRLTGNGSGSTDFSVERVILADAAGVMPVRTKEQERRIRRYKFLKKLVDSRPFEYFFPDMASDWKSRQGSEDYRNATPVMKGALVKAVNEDLSALLPNIRQDVLLIWGDGDTATPLSDGQKMEREIPGAGLAVIPGAGHFSFLDDPGRFAGIMRAYLDA